MDIKSDAPYPLSALSNFAAHDFTFRDVSCASMEGLLQSLKFNDASLQKDICLLTGKAAKEKGLTAQDWRVTQTLWWQGVSIARESDDYQAFLDDAYDALFSQNAAALDALLATGDTTLTHSIGVADQRETVLTEYELCSRLEKIRAEYSLIKEITA